MQATLICQCRIMLTNAALSNTLSLCSQVLTTTPMVPYRLVMASGKQIDLESPLDFPKDRNFEHVEEPTVDCTILVPETYTGAVLQLCAARRGELLVRETVTAHSVVALAYLET
jgi:translation elongation factor EF-4